MMYGGGGGGWAWMVLMPRLWVGVLGLIAWAIVSLVRRPSDRVPPAARRETPQEILDRRFASGEIDTDAYTRARETLAGRRTDPS